jgi:hypothetical protein
MIYKTLHRKLKIEQHKFHVKPRSTNSVALERLAFPAPLVTPIVLLLKRHEHHLIMKGFYKNLFDMYISIGMYYQSSMLK